MRLSIPTVLLGLLGACGQTTEGPDHGGRPAPKDEAAARDARAIGPATKGFDRARLWTPGEHSGDDPVPAVGARLLWLCGDELVDGVVSIEPVADPMVDQNGEKTGRRITGPCDARAILGGLPSLKAGPVKTWLTGGLEPGASVPVPQAGRAVELHLREIGHTGYALVLDAEGSTWTIVRHEDTDDGRLTLHWAGDLDGDGKLDLLVDETPKYSYALYALYLSSAASDGPVARVAEARVLGD